MIYFITAEKQTNFCSHQHKKYLLQDAMSNEVKITECKFLGILVLVTCISNCNCRTTDKPFQAFYMFNMVKLINKY